MHEKTMHEKSFKRKRGGRAAAEAVTVMMCRKRKAGRQVPLPPVCGSGEMTPGKAVML
jgi:hypothetical protein